MTPSEAYLADLSRRAFLSLWSYSNVYTDEGRTGGKGDGQELCDLLVVFGNDVLIFSDKHNAFGSDGALAVRWGRWYRRAIAKSVRQLLGAKCWLERFPDRIFVDPGCTRPFPVSLPPRAHLSVHLVAVTRGSYEACQAHFGKKSTGSLRLNTSVDGAAEPFTIGLPGGRDFVHVFDEVTLDAVFGELDTARDFVDYLRKRRAFLERAGRTIMAAGEEQLLSIYMRGLDAEGEHDFVVNHGAGVADLLVFDESFWPAMLADPGYQRKKEADKASYIWDSLTERFIAHGSPNVVPGLPPAFEGDLEPIVRCLASESRLRRRMLGEGLREFIRSLQLDKRRARLMHSNSHPNRAYVLLAEPFHKDYANYDEYRRFRVALLTAHCRVARLHAVEAVEIVGFAMDSPNSRQKGGSEDLIYILEPEFTPELRAAAQRAQAEFGIFQTGKMKVSEGKYDEFPRA